MKFYFATSLLAILSTTGWAANGPADCVYAAKQWVPSITNQKAVELCRGATDRSPAKCLYDLRQNVPSTTIEDGVELCKPVLCQ